jgi:sucrose-6-phosphate hydrolase SacC (GH32 family)
MKRFLSLAAIGLACLSFSSASAAVPTNEIVFAEFEGDTWGEWTVTGNAFGDGPARGALPKQQAVSGFLGSGFVNSYVGGDDSTGTLTSPEFTIKLPYLNFLVGGGNKPGTACINLIIDGTNAWSATGTEDEKLSWHSWQLFQVVGKKARLQIVDSAKGGWGHVNVDQITFSQRPRIIPYFNDAVTRAMSSVNAAAPRASADATRPIYHFTPPANWMNDPNGPIFYAGYYHIYYQHNPFGDAWGHMHWGHARSRDLVFWKHMPIALWPSKEKGEDHVFSGCATTNSRGQLLAFYTSIGYGKSATDYAEQWVALGDADGNTYTKHPGNPILSEKLHGDTKVWDWRDPFVFRDGARTFLVCGGNLNQGKGGQAVVLLYEATDGELTAWKYRGVLFTHPDAEVKNIECPLFFKLGDRWVLIVSPHRRVEYFTGRFDADAGKFLADQRGLMDHSGDYYAPNCMEDPQGRRVLWGWIKGFKGGRGWNGAFTLPRILTMAADGHLRQDPPVELSQLRGQAHNLQDVKLNNATNHLDAPRGDTLELSVEFQAGDAKQFGLMLRCSDAGAPGVLVSFDGREIEVAGAKSKLSLDEGKLRLRVFLDRSVLEVYANEQACFSRVIYPGERDLGLAVFARGGTATVRSLEAWSMKPIIK